MAIWHGLLTQKYSQTPLTSRRDALLVYSLNSNAIPLDIDYHGVSKGNPPLRSQKSRILVLYHFCQKTLFWKFRYYIINVKIWPDEKGSISLIAKIFRPRFARLYTIFSRPPLKEPICMVKTPYFFLAALRADLLKMKSEGTISLASILRKFKIGGTISFLDKIPDSLEVLYL